MYLITGCAGFIGFSMCKYLIQKKIYVIGIDSINQYYSKNLKLERLNKLKSSKYFRYYKLNLCNKIEIENMLKKYGQLKIIHFAAQPGVMYSYVNPDSYFENNVVATKNLIDVTKKNLKNSLIFMTSSSVYGDKKKFPISEKSKLSAINYYAKTKIECEKLVKKNQKYFNSVKILRPFTVYGPYGRPDMLILKLLVSIKRKQKLNIYNFGNYLRDFTYIDDVINIISKLSLINEKKLQIYNICALNPVKITKILSIIKKYTKKLPPIQFMPKRKGEMLITYGSNKKLSNKLGFRKFTSIDDGLKKTIKWFSFFKNKKFLYLQK